MATEEPSVSGPPASRRWVQWTVRGIGAVLALGAGIPWLLVVLSILRSRFGDPAQDPHGYVLLFGTIFAVPAGFLCALGVGLAAPTRLRSRVLTFGVLVALLLAVALVLAVASAPPWIPPGAALEGFTS